MIQAKGIEKSFGSLKVLKGVDFNVSEAEVVSIMGASGAGKSTFVKLLLRLYDPTEGSILLNGHDIKEFADTGGVDLFNLLG